VHADACPARRLAHLRGNRTVVSRLRVRRRYRGSCRERASSSTAASAANATTCFEAQRRGASLSRGRNREVRTSFRDRQECGLTTRRELETLVSTTSITRTSDVPSRPAAHRQVGDYNLRAALGAASCAHRRRMGCGDGAVWGLAFSRVTMNCSPASGKHERPAPTAIPLVRDLRAP